MSFDFKGIYRVQSRNSSREGRLIGKWFFRQGTLSSEILNRVLSREPRWSGVPINVRPALVTRRSGMFKDVPDNLYKIECFEPATGYNPLPCHIIDVLKAADQWPEKFSNISRLFVNGHAMRLAGRIDDLFITIANEYCCHEGGHTLGQPVQLKSRLGYFKPGGKIAWPLVWVEEFRADLHSYAIAVESVGAANAVALFIYNCLNRWAGDRLSIQHGTYGYGTIPYLLFLLLFEKGLLELKRKKSAGQSHENSK